MKNIATRVRTIVAVAVVGMLAVLVVPQPQPSQAAEGSAPVTVVNTPLPVSLAGTGKIAGTVAATQSGAWNVGVTSLPAVQFASGATVGISGFSNTEATALFISDIDAAARGAVAVALCSDTGNGTCASVYQEPNTATLPVGERFVIEQISHGCNGGAYINASLNGYVHQYVLPGAGGGFSQQQRIYVDGGVPNGLGFHLNNPVTDSICRATLSGHLVHIAAPFPIP
jgi:hypothetical protein